MKYKVTQPFHNPSEFQCFLEGARRVAAIFSYGVSHASSGGGLPTEIQLFETDRVPEPEPDMIEDKPVKKKTKKKTGAKPTARAQ